jgi:cell division protein YceG involved in septum cleavage
LNIGYNGQMTQRWAKVFTVTAAATTLFLVFTLSLPYLLSYKIEYERAQTLKHLDEEFPVTVDKYAKVIRQDPVVDAYLNSAYSPFQAALGNVGEVLSALFDQIAVSIASTAVYQSLASADGRFVAVMPGMRKEQVASAFGKVLGWSAQEEKAFLISTSTAITTSLSEGVFTPGMYLVEKGMKPSAARALVDRRFAEEILARYGENVAKAVPLGETLTIASLIQREAAGPSDMREISGVIWNRLFKNMKLQIDATVQYARATTAPTGSWWPAPRPRDLSIKSPYNTYIHTGLPPSPIASPSLAAVLAALNPVVTDCLFYFHDRLGAFHCSPTYAGHVALLKQYYGRGK